MLSSKYKFLARNMLLQSSNESRHENMDGEARVDRGRRGDLRKSNLSFVISEWKLLYTIISKELKVLLTVS